MADREMIDRWLDGDLDGDEADQLGERLAGDPALRRDWLRALRRDEALRRAARAVVARRRGRRRWAWAAVAAAAVLVLGVAAMWAAPADGRSVDPLTVDGRPHPPAEEIRGPAAIRLADGTAITAAIGARLSIAMDDGTAIRLAVGGITVAAAAQPQDRPLTVATAHAQVRVVGTRFRVDTGAIGTAVAVDEGVVEVRAAGAVRRLGAGAALWADDAGLAGRSFRILPDPDGLALQTAIDRMGPGDEVVLAPGDHRTRRGLRLSGGAATAPQRTLRGEPGARLLAADWSAVLVVDAVRVRVADLAIVPGPDLAEDVVANGIRILGSRDIVVVGCTIAAMPGDGITSQGSDRVRITGNTVRGCGHGSQWGQGGISVVASVAAGDGGGSWILVEDNTVAGNRITHPNSHGGIWSGGHGVGIFEQDAGSAGPGAPAYPGAITVRRTLAHGNDGAGIHLFRAPGTRIEGGILRHNGGGPGRDADLNLIAATGAVVRSLLIVPGPGIAPVRITAPATVEGCRQWGGTATAAGVAPLVRSPWLRPVADEAERTDHALAEGWESW
jgi:hypothetical protein